MNEYSTHRYTCRSCGTEYADLSTTILCCAPHETDTVVAVADDGVAYGG